MTRNGIDVSKYQGAVNWQKVKADGVEFAILRAGYGKVISQKDPCFEDNYAGCQTAGIPCGAYWYSYAMSPDEARQEASVCLEVLKGKKLEYPVYFDIEEKKQLSLGKAACSEIAEAFLQNVEQAGYWVGIYSSADSLEACISEALRKRYAVWVAQYGVSETTYSGDFGIWQKSDSGTNAGIIGNVDLDECYIDYPSLIRKLGLNGFAPASETEPPSDKSVSELAQEVLYGKWGNGQERKDRLTAAGYNYSAVQAAVNQLIAASQRQYTVVSGDTLTSIAQKYHTTVQAILNANHEKYPEMTADLIKTGWVLRV